MNDREHDNQITRRLLPSLLGIAACFAVASPALSEEGTSGSQPSAESSAPAGAAGMTVYIDPQTGALLSAPAPGSVPLQLSPRERNALSTSHQGLVEVPLPGGGYKLDLQGRFQNPLIATVGADGKVKMQHLSEPPAAHDRKPGNNGSAPPKGDVR